MVVVSLTKLLTLPLTVVNTTPSIHLSHSASRAPPRPTHTSTELFSPRPHVGHSLLLSSSHYANRSGFDRLSSRRAERRGAHWAAGV